MLLEPQRQIPPKQPRTRFQIILRFVEHPLVIALISVFATLLVQQVFLQISQPPGPPSISTIATLMGQEAQAAITHDSELVSSIYDAHAVVMDAGCQMPSQGNVWSGLTNILTRYSALPQITSLSHVDPRISWVPNDSTATVGYASATTIGALASGTDGNAQPIRGHEQWVFTKTTGGQWVISLFTYNLCLP